MVFVFRIGSLGDSLVILPALHHIKKRHENEKIVLITSEPSNALGTWDVVQYANVFDDVFTYHGGSLASIIQLVFKIRSIKESKTLYYLPPFRTKRQANRDRILFKLSGMEKIIGMDESVAKLAFRGINGELLTLETEYNRLLGTVLMDEEKEKNIANFLPAVPLLTPTKDNYKKVQTFLPVYGKEGFLIAIAHGTNMPAKKWELEKFKEVMIALNETLGNVAFVIVGGKEDFQEGEYLRQRVSNCINTAGKTSVIESAALLEQCDLFIGNDTGTMHLASVMGTPVVGIFSARDNPGKWEPYGKYNVIVRKKIECEGCMLVECIEKERECITSISVEEVRKQVLMLSTNIYANKIRKQ